MSAEHVKKALKIIDDPITTYIGKGVASRVIKDHHIIFEFDTHEQLVAYSRALKDIIDHAKRTTETP